MKKLLFLVFILLAFPMCVLADSTGSTSPITYKTSVKVKLLPEIKFSATIRGSYLLVNLDNQEALLFTTPVSFEQVDGKIKATVDGKDYISLKGFAINETMYKEENEVEFTPIQSAGGIMSVKYRGSFTVVPGTDRPALFNTLDMENYLKGVVPSEMPASWPMEALKAQAVAARSYAWDSIQARDYLNMTVASQVYGGKSKEHSRTNQAIEETKEIYALYNGRPIAAYFHSSSGGHTENSENVWSGTVPYIRAVLDDYDRHSSNTHHYNWTAVAPNNSIKEKLALPATSSIVSLKVLEKSKAGGVQQVQATVYDSQTKLKTNIVYKPSFVKSPDSFRSIFGVSLKSIKFDVKGDSSAKIIRADGSISQTDHLAGYQVQLKDDTKISIIDPNIKAKALNSDVYIRSYPSLFTFTGNGWGHGLGMSQWGARGMAEKGFMYDQILTYYYSGITVGTYK
ncbi:SpoIID/LytB domain-containing protein [Bacillus salitolerans]|uniref:SpoIID/LytB domain-containing protein n=1 Tax=Bacillus salitolerans TaxID=1437434 RepID=A0ABW4LNS2_9BACI